MPWFQSLNKEDVHAMARRTKETKYSLNDPIVCEGETIQGTKETLECVALTCAAHVHMR